jgi:demethylspheroidene O-methyltransferase
VALPRFILDFRNRLLTDPRFISWAQRFPLTRPVARYNSSRLFDLLAGFAYSQVLAACVELNLLHHVGQNGSTLDLLSRAVGIAPERLDILVRAAVSLDVLAQRGERILLGSQGAALIAQPWIMRFIQHHKYFYQDLENAVELISERKGGEAMRRYWSYDGSSTGKDAYSALMAASQVAVSEQILAVFDFKRFGRMLDIGGGSGAFLRAVCTQNSAVDAHLYDLPGVVSLVESGSITTHGGDFRTDDLPKGMDLISVVRVIHDHDDDVVAGLFRNIRRACDAGTTVLIAEPFAGNRATARVTDAYFNLYFAAMGQGVTRSPQRIAEIAAPHGFSLQKVYRTHMPLITGAMTLLAK